MLPDLWAKLNETILKSQSLFGLRQYPDIRRLEDEKLIRHLNALNFTENQIDTVMAAADRAKSYQTIIDSLDYGEATSSFNDYATMVRKTSIFIRPALFETFKQYEVIIKTALIEFQMNREGFNERRSFEHMAKLSEAAGKPLSDFEEKIRSRLWNTMDALNNQ